MSRKPRAIELTPMEMTHTVLALRQRIEILSKQEDENPDGSEYQDMIVADHVIAILTKALEAAAIEDGVSQPGTSGT